jgi:3-oxoadipate enol-lactonase
VSPNMPDAELPDLDLPDPMAMSFVLPWLPEAKIVQVAGRGEFFVRVHRHEDPSVPTLALFHGWTASADLQFFTAYRALAERYSFVAIDHRGHGRGLRILDPFQLEDAADDMAAVLHQLGVDRVVTLGYSMGGPISMLFTRRHPHLVEALVAQATALEWRASLRERLTWMGLPVVGAVLRSWAYPRYLRRAIARVIPVGHELEAYLPWILGEMQRGASQAIVEAGRCLSRYDARDWADGLGVRAGVLVTTRDRLVPPRKQRRLATALNAAVRELDADHLCTMAEPRAYADATLALLDEVLAVPT